MLDKPTLPMMGIALNAAKRPTPRCKNAARAFKPECGSVRKARSAEKGTFMGFSAPVWIIASAASYALGLITPLLAAAQ